MTTAASKPGLSASERSTPQAAGRARTKAPPESAVERELALIERAQRDPAAFAPLYETYVDLVWRFALNRLGDRERAADATSQTFSKALAALPNYRPERRGETTTFRSWLMMIARNVVIDEVRKHRPTVALDASSAQPWLIDQRPSPEESAIAADERRRVERALAQLPDVQRQIVELRAAGLKGVEIAELLNMTASAVRTAHFRAYVRLRELLREPEDHQGSSA